MDSVSGILTDTIVQYLGEALKSNYYICLPRYKAKWVVHMMILSMLEVQKKLPTYSDSGMRDVENPTDDK